MVTIYIALSYSFPSFEPASCSISGSNWCFLARMQFSQQTGKVVWYSHLFKNFPQFVVIHTVKGFSVVNEAEVKCFSGILLLFLQSNESRQFDLWFLCLFLHIWKFLVHVVLKPSLKDFEHYLAITWNEHDCMVVWAFFGLLFFGIRMKSDPFQSLVAIAEFSKFAAYWVPNFDSIIF